jgi:hypothetical protein
MDLRTLAPRPFVLYFPGKIAQADVRLQVHLTWNDSQVQADTLPATQPFAGQVSYEADEPAELKSFGPTKRVPLGTVVLARSGDKGGNANVGLWVRYDAEWPWLRSFLSTERVKQLLGNDYRPQYRVERFEMPGIRAVHFVIYGILEDGVSSSSLIDGFAKSLGEFIRARHVDVPVMFLARPEVGRTL